MAKAFVVITVARQCLGEYIFVRTEKGFTEAAKADAYLNEIKKKLVGPDGKPRPEKVITPQGEAECLSEVGVFEVEIE